MRYFLVVLFAFTLFHLPPFDQAEWLAGPAVRAVVALGLGMLLSGLHHLVYVQHYVRMMPSWIPAATAVVYFSALLRIVFGLGVLVPSLRCPVTIGSLVLLCFVAPVNIRIAFTRLHEGQLIDADWFRWMRVVLHASWIIWCGWCLALLPKG